MLTHLGTAVRPGPHRSMVSILQNFSWGTLELQTTEIYVHLSDEDELMQKIRPDKADQQKSLEKVKMKECPNCGAMFAPDRKLCLCGYDFTQNRCPGCRAAIENGSHFCHCCGMSLEPPKPECICGHDLKSNYNACPNCGRPTTEILKLWDEKYLKKWQGFDREENESVNKKEKAMLSNSNI